MRAQPWDEARLQSYRRGILAEHAQWEQAQLDRFPPRWRRLVKREYDRRLEQGEFAANTYLRELAEPLQKLRLPASASDIDIRDKARVMASLHIDIAGHYMDLALARQSLAGRLRGWEIEPPGSTVTDEGAVRRMTDEVWLRRQIRKTHARQVEALAIRAGLVWKRADLYVSEDTFVRRQDQKRRNAATLEEMEAVNDLGQAIILAEIVQRSLANPRIRRGELMTRIAGFEHIAQALGHEAAFITLTCPSRFHARHFLSGEPNDRHDGSKPRQAQAYLRQVWARIRAKLARDDCPVYGFRIAEPHHDATPHWHLLLFVEKSKLGELEAVCRYYAMQDSSDEPGAAEHRLEWVRIDPGKGGAAGYIAKYVSKNLDGHGIEADHEGTDAKSGAARVDAWASAWSARQFQQIGGPPVGVWRELRRIGSVTDTVTERARKAADNGDWAGYVQSMGGPTLARRDRPLAPLYRLPIRNGCPIPIRNRYGETPDKRVSGLVVRATGEIIETRERQWVIRRRAGEDRAPQTRVNNCTAPLRDKLMERERMPMGHSHRKTFTPAEFPAGDFVPGEKLADCQPQAIYQCHGGSSEPGRTYIRTERHRRPGRETTPRVDRAGPGQGS